LSSEQQKTQLAKGGRRKERMTASVETAIGPQRRSGFFNAMAVALLLVVVIGFSPTFFLRPFFDVPPVPDYVLFHGIVMTAWFAWFLVQSTFIKTNRIRLHQQLGVAGIGLAAAVVAMGLTVALGGVTRVSEADARALVPLFWLNLCLLLDFVLCTSAALLWRRKPDVHKRLMLFASISLIGPAFGRIAGWSVLSGFAGVINALPALFILALVVHDVMLRKRPHFVTAAVGGALLASLAVAGLMGNSEFGESFVLGLR
jgi:hypothetical protein